MCTAAKVEPPTNPIDHYIRTYEERSPDPFAIVEAFRDTRGNVIDFIFRYANPAAIKSSGGGDLIGRRMLDLFPGNAQCPELFLRYMRILEEQGADEVEVEYQDPALNGWFRNLAVALDKDHLALSWRDISHRKGFEEQLKVIAREYRHRLKNAFTVMGSLMRQSLKSAPTKEALAENVYNRLLSMSVSQDLLVEEAGAGSLAGAITRSLEPFAGPQLSITQGPDVQVAAPVVISLCLALNELATNAVKFGGLSQAGGKVEVNWTVEGDRVRLVWGELSPRIVTEPEATGFGSRLIDDVGRRLPGGKVTRRFEPEGLVVDMSFLTGM